MANTPQDERRIDADYYDSTYFDSAHQHLDFDSPFQRYRVAKVLEIFAPGAEQRVLDLGCGWGTLEWALAPRVGEIVGVDFSARSVELCRQRLAELGLPNVRFLQADAGDTGLPAASFDVVLAADLFEHLYPEDSRRVVGEAFRVLAPGGRFSIWTPHRGHVLEILKNNDIVLRRAESHVDYKSMARLREMLEADGFVLEKAYYAEGHLPGLRQAERLLQRFVPPLRRRIAVLARKP
ncbi:MAG TPA: class I SAM-dependent methyltransferase [Thermoanaerobaculia bacterium]|nr:class I SAM-dependent methyltransferase [Thermoanaerobaculia bacterium]